MMDTARCDCQRLGRLLFLCVEVDCSMPRRLCASCRKEHPHHDIRQLNKQGSLKQFTINEDNLNKNLIVKQIFLAQKTINKLKTDLIQDINALIKLWEQQIQKTILKPLRLIKNTTFSQYQTQIRVTIQNQTTTAERLNEIAKQIRELQNPSLKQKSTILDICQNTLYIITQEMINLREQLGISNSKFIKSVKELYPFAPTNQKFQAKIKKSKEKLKKQIQVLNQSLVNIQEFNQQDSNNKQTQQEIPFFQQSLLNIYRQTSLNLGKKQFPQQQYHVIVKNKNRYFIPKK